ncbi:MAG: hypothetical protein D6683_02795 [Actinomyces sp.]|nr:MAG: hypothetical protein D6683_02795 [Actinomyces sp.]
MTLGDEFVAALRADGRRKLRVERLLEEIAEVDPGLHEVLHRALSDPDMPVTRIKAALARVAADSGHEEWSASENALKRWRQDHGVDR